MHLCWCQTQNHFYYSFQLVESFAFVMAVQLQTSDTLYNVVSRFRTVHEPKA